MSPTSKRRLDRLCLMSVSLIFCFQMSVFGAGSAFSADSPVKPSAGNWRPFHGTCQDKQGFITDIVRELLTNTGIAVEFFPIPYSRAFTETKQGKYTGIPSLGKESEPTCIHGNEEVGAFAYCYFKKSQDAQVCKGASSLKGRKTATIPRATMGEDKAFIEDPKNRDYFVPAPYTKSHMGQVVEMPMSGRVDTFVNEFNITPNYLFKHPSLNGKIKSAACIKPGKLNMGFTPTLESREHVQKISKIIDEEIMRMHNSERISEIMKTYGLKSWKSMQIVRLNLFDSLIYP